MTQRRVRPAAPRDPIDTELQAAMAESLALALRATYRDWLHTNLAKTRGPDEVMAGLGMFVGAAADDLLGRLGLTAAEETAYVKNWLTFLHDAMADARQSRPDGGDGAGPPLGADPPRKEI